MSKADIAAAVEEEAHKAKSKKDKKNYAQLDGASSEEDLLVAASGTSGHKWKGKTKAKAVFGKAGKHKDKAKAKTPKDASPDARRAKSPKSPSPGTRDRGDSGSVHSEGGPLCLWPIVGSELDTAIRYNPSHDGLPIPACVRRAIDVVANHGLKEEGIYRVSAAKSRVDAIRDSVDQKGELGRLEAGCDGVHAAAGFLKLYLRSLPSHLLTQELLPQFEKAARECPCRGESPYCRCLAGDRVAALLRRLPAPNYYLTAYVFLHFRQVIAHERYNKMNLVSVGLIMEPMLGISQRLLTLFLRNAHADHHQATPLFKDIKLRRYVPPLRPPPDKLAAYLPNTREAIEEELAKQQGLLKHLHWQIEELKRRGMTDDARETEIWEVQMVETQLKRRLRAAKASGDGGAEGPEGDGGGPCLELFQEKQLLAAQMELKRMIAEERETIASLRRELREAGGVAEEAAVEESPEERTRLKEELQREQLRHDTLLSEIIEERSRCARLRAEMELIEVRRERAAAAAAAQDPKPKTPKSAR